MLTGREQAFPSRRLAEVSNETVFTLSELIFLKKASPSEAGDPNAGCE